MMNRTNRIIMRCIHLVVLASAVTVSAETARELIYQAYDTPDANSAISLFTQALEKDPELIYAYTGRGLQKQEQGDITGAIEDFTQAIEKNVLFRDAYVWRAEARKQQGDLEGYEKDMAAAEAAKARGDYALVELDRAVQAEPDSAKTYLERARYKKQKGDSSGAVEDYDRYLTLVGRPKNHLVIFERANAKKRSGDIDGALNDYSTALRMFPGNADAYAKRAALRREVGDVEGSKSDSQEVRKIQRVEKMERIEKLNRALESAPDQSYLLMQRSKLWMDIGNYTNALNDVRGVQKTDPDGIRAKRLEKQIQRSIEKSNRFDSETGQKK